jgi:hypothetical protein
VDLPSTKEADFAPSRHSWSLGVHFSMEYNLYNFDRNIRHLICDNWNTFPDLGQRLLRIRRSRSLPARRLASS